MQANDLLTDHLRHYFPDETEPARAIRRGRLLEWCGRNDCRIFSLAETGSRLLAEIPGPPRLLFVRGDARLLSAPALAIVGTRRPSSYGLSAALRFARALARLGLCIVSGLARGIDSAAHRGALSAKGATVAVLAHGLDRVYPSENAPLVREILGAGGCVCAEYPPGIAPLRRHFPQRNRLLAGLALGTLVVEAAERSGSLITAALALEQNREVFVLPGEFDREGFAGSHRLIQQGAKLVLHPRDILSELLFERPDPRFTRLERAFSELQGRATLEALFTRGPWCLSDLTRELEEAKEAGRVTEISPQNFLWIADAK